MVVESNPYAPPASRLDVAPAAPTIGEYATTGQRFSNWFLDTLGIYVFAALIGVAVSLLDESLLETTPIDGYLFGLVISTVYYAASERLMGRTPAKLITGTRVVSEDGGPASTAQIIGRTLARFVPFEAFSFLGGDGRPTGWHDTWSKTRVVRTRGPAGAL